jgi:hypothetical protein
MNLNSLFSMRRRTEREDALLDLVLKSPLLDEIIGHSEEESLKRRRELLAEIPLIERARAVAEAKATKTAELALAAFEQAEAAFMRARDAHNVARVQGIAVPTPFNAAIREIEDTVRSLADPRLQTFCDHLSNIKTNELVSRLAFWVVQTPSGFGAEGEVRYGCNVDDVQRAKSEIDSVIARARAMQLEAVSSSDVSTFLGESCEALSKTLAVLEINPPTLTRAEHEVGAPMPWSGAPRWMVDELLPVFKDDPKRTPNPNVSKRRASLARA